MNHEFAFYSWSLEKKMLPLFIDRSPTTHLKQFFSWVVYNIVTLTWHACFYRELINLLGLINFYDAFKIILQYYEFWVMIAKVIPS